MILSSHGIPGTAACVFGGGWCGWWFQYLARHGWRIEASWRPTMARHPCIASNPIGLDGRKWSWLRRKGVHPWLSNKEKKGGRYFKRGILVALVLHLNIMRISVTQCGINTDDIRIHSSEHILQKANTAVEWFLMTWKSSFYDWYLYDPCIHGNWPSTIMHPTTQNGITHNNHMSRARDSSTYFLPFLTGKLSICKWITSVAWQCRWEVKQFDSSSSKKAFFHQHCPWSLTLDTKLFLHFLSTNVYAP